MNRTIYRLTKNFPRHEMFAMTSQIRRASISITFNIAAGSGRNSDKDFAHFLEQSYGSLMEVASIFYLALDECYVKESDLEPLFDELEKLARRIAALNRSLAVQTSKTPFARSAKLPALDPRPSTFD
jgi:four helix bundle protein